MIKTIKVILICMCVLLLFSNLKHIFCATHSLKLKLVKNERKTHEPDKKQRSKALLLFSLIFYIKNEKKAIWGEK